MTEWWIPFEACYKVISILKLYIWIAQHIGGWFRWSDPFYLNNIIVFILILCGGGSILALKIPSFDENDPTLHILQLPILVTLMFEIKFFSEMISFLDLSFLECSRELR